MKEKSTIPLIILLLVTFFVNRANAQLQNVTATSGGNFTGSTYSISYTLGEPVISTLAGTNLLVTQGFHQPRLIVTALGEIMGLSVNIKAYPNPATDFVHLETSGNLSPGSLYQLYSLNGSLIAEKQIDALLTEISFQSLISSTYILKVIQHSQTIKTFKIIKK
jgi:hypothetical protein